MQGTSTSCSKENNHHRVWTMLCGKDVRLPQQQKRVRNQNAYL